MEKAPLKCWPYCPKENQDQVQLWPNGWVSFRHHGKFYVTRQGMLSGESLYRQICRMLRANAQIAWVVTIPEMVNLLVS